MYGDINGYGGLVYVTEEKRLKDSFIDIMQ